MEPILDTQHAVILAAGYGSRLDPDEGHKILTRIGGHSLFDYHLVNFTKLGVEHLTIVTGYDPAPLREALETKPVPDGPQIHFAHNPEFDKAHGLSVLAGAESGIEDLGLDRALPFWLVMSDHLYDPALFDKLRDDFENANSPSFEGVLATDKKITTIFDLPDATKLSLSHPEGNFEKVGKKLENFQRIDTGLFWCGRGFVDALQAERAQRDDCSPSDAIRRLSEDNSFYFWDIGPYLWQDVDTPEAKQHAETLLERDFEQDPRDRLRTLLDSM